MYSSSECVDCASVCHRPRHLCPILTFDSVRGRFPNASKDRVDQSGNLSYQTLQSRLRRHSRSLAMPTSINILHSTSAHPSPVLHYVPPSTSMSSYTSINIHSLSMPPSISSLHSHLHARPSPKWLHIGLPATPRLPKLTPNSRSDVYPKGGRNTVSFQSSESLPISNRRKTAHHVVTRVCVRPES